MLSVCVYCGSSDKIKNCYLDAAYQLGRTLAERGLRLVYGGGSTGLMGAVANGALESKGIVIGVIPEIFNTPTLAHRGLTRLEIVRDMHLRKSRLAELSDGFIALPGGFGTMEELFEILTWAQIGLHQKPVGLLNINNYFDSLLEMVECGRKEGFTYQEHHSLLAAAKEPETLLEAMQNHHPPAGLERWLTRID